MVWTSPCYRTARTTEFMLQTEADPSPFMTTKRVSNSPAHTPQHKSTWEYSYTNTLPPILTLPAAWNRKNPCFPRNPSLAPLPASFVQ